MATKSREAYIWELGSRVAVDDSKRVLRSKWQSHNQQNQWPRRLSQLKKRNQWPTSRYIKAASKLLLSSNKERFNSLPCFIF